MTADTFARVIALLDGAIDWPRLGREVYCSAGGEDFFAPEQRDAILDAGLAFAAELAEQLASGGRSLYVGAGVAELAPILYECLCLGRAVRWFNLPGVESELLNAALTEVSATAPGAELALPRIETGSLAELPVAAFDHLWLASVLTDPECFPTLHDELYERAGSALAVAGDVSPARRADDRARAEALSAEALARLAVGGLLTTSGEERPFFDEAARRAGATIHWQPGGRLSGIVGDVLGYGRLHEDAGGNSRE